jgi:hypothetical protein
MLSGRVAALETNKTDDEEAHVPCRRHVQQTLGLAEVVELEKCRDVLQKSIPEECRPWSLPHGPVLFAPGSTACLLSRTSPLGLVRAPFST